MAAAGAPSEQLRAWPFRYEIIDGLRGLAALAVVVHHLGIAPIGHYAVMLFFVISGYCIAASAETARHNRASFGTFLLRRLRRIYPPYFLAIVFYVLTRLIKVAAGGHNDLIRPALDWVQNLTLTQWVSLPAHPVATAAQNPKLIVTAFWSLNYEEQFYLVMALSVALSVRRRVPIAAVVLALAVVGFLWNCAWPDGWITGFFIEYWLYFSLGAMLFYALCLCPGRRARGVFVVAMCALASFCAFRILRANFDSVLPERAYSELAIGCAFTALLFVARPASAWISRSQAWRPIAALGAISYSLYLIHQFNLTLVESTVNRILPHAWESVRLGAMVALQIVIAAAFWFVCERPFLNRSSAPGGVSTGSALAPLSWLWVTHRKTVKYRPDSINE
jgi:peptidoglycan/LPS O-acetylase OafA/YrhL